MKSVTRKSDMKRIAARLRNHYEEGNPSAFWSTFEQQVLACKVPFPILEYLADQLFTCVPGSQQLTLIDELMERAKLGSYPIVGKLLQLRLANHFEESYQKAVACIIQGDTWFVCDIIGERVFGYGTRHYFEQSLPHLQDFTRHNNPWIVRSVGVAMHYATKKGLPSLQVQELWLLALHHGHITNFHVKKGFGWAAKTIAKFHPTIVEPYRERWDGPEVARWFRSKVLLGLSRSDRYAGRYA